MVLFGVPGAFTGVCSQAHVPGYVSKVRTIVASPTPCAFCECPHGCGSLT